MTTGYRYDMRATIGADFSRALTVLDDETGLPINLSGYSGSAPLARRFGETGIVSQFNVAITTPQSGLVTISLSGSQTTGLGSTEVAYSLHFASGAREFPAYFGYVQFYPTL